MLDHTSHKRLIETTTLIFGMCLEFNLEYLPIFKTTKITRRNILLGGGEGWRISANIYKEITKHNILVGGE